MSKEQKFNYDEDAPKGRVTLVGAGPGAVDLLTIRGQRVLQQAEVVVYDDLANAELLDICPSSAKRIYVGKRAGVHCMLQTQISEILVSEASQGKRVVRLKGGDPLVFARGGEEMETLAKAGIAFDIVPGVTSAIAAGASTGIPLTHRDHASAVVFVTGHECAGKSARPNQVDWASLAKTGATLCIYMGVRRLADISEALQEGGLVGTTPVAIVANATLDEQTVHVTTLEEAPIYGESLRSKPSLIIVGDVVRWAELHDTMISMQAATV